jgi:hypothetical protein
MYSGELGPHEDVDLRGLVADVHRQEAERALLFGDALLGISKQLLPAAEKHDLAARTLEAVLGIPGPLQLAGRALLADPTSTARLLELRAANDRAQAEFRRAMDDLAAGGQA